MKFIYFLYFLFIASCAQPDETNTVTDADANWAMDTVITTIKDPLPATVSYLQGMEINTVTTRPDELVAFSKTLLGVPYLYASTDPQKGFDCSGFITYVFNHFNIAVPRSSIDFTNVGKQIPEEMARPGDLILFTGTDSTLKEVGHMGIVESNDNGKISFIHSTSGKAYAVVITPMETYYRSRFVKIIRVFPDEYFE